MDKEFEEWKQESVDDEMRAGLEIAGEYFDLDYLWNAAKEISKQYWLDRSVEVAENKRKSAARVYGDGGHASAKYCGYIAEAIKELKNE